MATYTKTFVSYDKNSGGIIGQPDKEYINFTVREYTGRNNKQETFTITAANPSTTDAFTQRLYVKQTGKPLYISFDNKGFTITNDTPYIMITGETNSPFMSIDSDLPAASNILEQGELIIQVTKDIIPIKDLNNTLHNKIPNDPGAISAYKFAIKVPIPTNPDITKQRIINYEIIIGVPSDDNSSINNRISTTIRVAQGYDYMLNVTPQIVNFDYNGGTQSVSIESNVNWTIS